MKQKFRLFVQKHAIGTYTVTVPGVRNVSFAWGWDDDVPAAPRLAAYGMLLEECKDDLQEALAKWLSKADLSGIGNYTNYRENQYLEKVDLELRPNDRHGKKRHDKLKLKFSLLISKGDDQQFLVTVPKLMDPQLSFYCYKLDELKAVAERELSAYFSDETLEEILLFEYQRQEFLDEIEVSFSPLKPQQQKKKKSDDESEEFWALRGSGVNLTARVGEGRLQRAYRRDREVGEILNVLAAERNNCVILVGPSGVGKTAIMHEVARRIREGNCPEELRKRQVWQTSPNQLIAGCSFIGQWQQKLQNVVDEIKQRRHVLHIDDVVGLLEAGRHSKGDENMALFLKSFVADGTIIVVGESTPERLRIGQNKDNGFLRQFRTIDIAETNEDDTLGILGTVSAGLERTHNVRILPEALEAATELTQRFQPYQALPGKAVAFVERLAAEAGQRAEGTMPQVTRQVAVAAFARHTGLPEFILADHLTLEPAQVEHHFATRLIGQPDAVRAMVDLVTTIKAGLNDPHKPLGCFFFVGPTGVGKTEMAKSLAEYLFGSPDRMLRFDMSEYAEPMAVARLIGSGVADNEGELTKRIRLQPFSVVLLDEFEKANPAIFDVMLQVLGEGRLTDAAGRTADFRSAIVIMTSNLGASAREQRKTGIRVGDAVEASETHFSATLEKFFRPEFLNRIDRVVIFRALNEEAMRQIATREIAKLLDREGIKRRHLLVEFEEDVIDLLLATGFSPLYGARPLKRDIEARVIVPLSRYLVAHRITTPHLVQIRRDGGSIALQATSLDSPRAKVKTAPAQLAARGAGERAVSGKELVECLAKIRLALDRWSSASVMTEIRNEASTLLGQTRQRKFQSYGPEASRIWGRIYHLERLLKRLEQLKERVAYLEEFATFSEREARTAPTAARYQAELAQSYADLCRDADFLEVELLCAHLRDCGQALVRLKRLGRGQATMGSTPWLVQLARMYLQWAKRKGYELEVLAPTESYRAWLEAQGLPVKQAIPNLEAGPPVKPLWAALEMKDFPGLLKRVEAFAPDELCIAVRGTNVYGFLKGEGGIHKLVLRDEGAAAPVQTVAVEVSPLADDAKPAEHLAALAQEKAAAGAPKTTTEVPPIVRVYATDGDRYVRDLRTELRATTVREVLEGDLDSFILAYLKTTEAAAAWE